MSKHHLSSIRLLVIITITTLVCVYGFGMELGYGIVIIPVTVGYTIYLNFKAAHAEKVEAEQN